METTVLIIKKNNHLTYDQVFFFFFFFFLSISSYNNGEYDRSAMDAYSNMVPDPTFALVEGPCWPTVNFVSPLVFSSEYQQEN
jgi:hypothetical protein